MKEAVGSVRGDIREKLRGARRRSFVGRAVELSRLERFVTEDGPVVCFVHGIGGIGKSALLDAFECRASEQGARLFRLDGRSVEPTPRGLLAALAMEFGAEVVSVSAAAAALGSLSCRVVLAFDHYELLRLLDAWLRREFVPALPSSVRVVLFGRSAPVAAWADWQPLVRTIRLTPLDAVAARALLERHHVSPADIPRVQRFAGGHPLALELAASAIAERPELPIDQIAARHVLDELARLYLDDARDRETRAALEAASVVRRATRSVVAAMLGDEAADGALARLAQLSFVERASDGFVVHQSVRQAIEGVLRAVDPSRHRTLRRAAWASLRRELPTIGRAQSWRYVADILYLSEHHVIRDAFFPTDEHRFAVEEATPADLDSILSMSRRFDPPAGIAATAAWWRSAPEAFRVARDRDGQICAYYLLARGSDLDARIREEDPLAARWSAHLAASSAASERPVLWLRRMLATETGEALSEVRAVCWLDVKRTYIENPDARHLYVATLDPDDSYLVLKRLGFRWVHELSMPDLGTDGRSLETLILDFEPGGVFGWIGRLMDEQYAPVQEFDAQRLGDTETSAPCYLDEETRELVVDGVRVRLTPREFGLLRYLADHPERVVDREELLQAVWGQGFAGSNVVDAAVRALRKKLHPYGRSIQTVKGFGYRFGGFPA